jgi:hypothetical protein
MNTTEAIEALNLTDMKKGDVVRLKDNEHAVLEQVVTTKVHADNSAEFEIIGAGLEGVADETVVVSSRTAELDGQGNVITRGSQAIGIAPNPKFKGTHIGMPVVDAIDVEKMKFEGASTLRRVAV